MGSNSPGEHGAWPAVRAQYLCAGREAILLLVIGGHQEEHQVQRVWWDLCKEDLRVWSLELERESPGQATGI